ncbi:hypothetical protein GGP93_001244 [Salinibacter ruber]|nr:hypothetical protein [Salinibacter ruber]
MKALVHPVSIADPLSDSCEIADYDCSDSCLMQSLYQPRRGFVQEVFYLVADLL